MAFVRLRRTLPLSVLALLAGCAPPSKPAAATTAESADTVPAWLLARAAAESTAAAAASTLMGDFQFKDAVDSSGITFENMIVDDAGRAYKKVHYDHGTGVAAADVDGDSRPDLFFVSQRGSSQLWKNLGRNRFVDWTDSAGLRMTDAIAVGAAFADIDNDGDPDLFVTTVRHGNRLFENQGGGRFRDITVQAGVGYVGHSSGAVFFDYDGDGRLDLFVCNVGSYTTEVKGPGGYFVGREDAFHGHTHADRVEASLLYRNLGNNRFREVSRATGLVDRSWSGDATMLDVDADGHPDLYLPNMQGEDHLWRNLGGTRFSDVSKRLVPRTPWGAMGVKAFDWNGDERIDVLVTDMHSDMFTNLEAGDREGEARKSNPGAIPADFFPTGTAQFIFGNALFTQRADGSFEDRSDSAGTETYWPWGPSVDDLNADGWQDIFLPSSMNFPFRYAPNVVLLNDAGKRFLPSAFRLGVEPRAGGRLEKPWFTLECNGADRDAFLCRGCYGPGAGSVECSHKASGGLLTMMGSLGSRSAVILDLDGDGDLDVVTNEFNDRPQILVSDLAARHPVHTLAIRLRGIRSNREGIGAVVTVTLADGRRLMRVMDGKSGYLSQSDLPLIFGLGADSSAARADVRWPSGTTQSVSGPLAAGQTLEITEPGAE